MTAARKCSDSRDRIYATLGLLPSHLTDLIEPRYDPGRPNVYSNQFWVVVTAKSRLNFPDITSQGAIAVKDYPSSAPDFLGPPTNEYPVEEGGYASGASAAYMTFGFPASCRAHRRQRCCEQCNRTR
jgi:hypothetical protein